MTKNEERSKREWRDVNDRRTEIIRLNDEIAKYKEQVKQQKEELTQLHWDTKDMHSDQWYIEELTEENIQLKESLKRMKGIARGVMS